MKHNICFFVLLFCSPVFASTPLGTFGEQYQGSGESIWKEQMTIDDDRLEQAYIGYKASSSKVDRIEPAVHIFRGFLSRKDPANSFFEKTIIKDKRTLKAVERTLIWMHSSMRSAFKGFTAFNIDYITKGNKVSFYRERNKIYFFQPVSQCSEASYKKFKESYHPEFLFKNYSRIKTLLHDYEFLGFKNYAKRLSETLESKNKVKPIKDLTALKKMIAALYLEPYQDNIRKVKKRIYNHESQLKDLSKFIPGFILDILKNHGECLYAFPVSKFYSKVETQSTRYFGTKMLALIQSYADQHKSLPGDDIKLWADLYQHYLEKFHKLKDKDPAGQFESLTRDAWGRRFQVIRSDKRFWLLSQGRDSENKDIRLGPGFVK